MVSSTLMARTSGVGRLFEVQQDELPTALLRVRSWRRPHSYRSLQLEEVRASKGE